MTGGLNESPSEKEGKTLQLAQEADAQHGLNESPSEKEGKHDGVEGVHGIAVAASMKALPKRKGNSFLSSAELLILRASMKALPKRKGNP